MKDAILIQAEQLEELLPDALRTLFAPVHGDPFSEVPLGQMRVLRLLARSPQSPGELSTLLSVTPAAVTQVLAKLEHAGFVESAPQQHDRRCKVFQLSKTGATQMACRHQARSQHAVEILSLMEPSQRKALITALKNLVDLKPQPVPSSE